MVVGVAFTALVNALVADAITPLIAAAVGKRNFGNLSFTIHGSHFDYGAFFNALLSFILVATVVFFLVVKPVTHLMDRLGLTPREDPGAGVPRVPEQSPTGRLPLCLLHLGADTDRTGPQHLKGWVGDIEVPCCGCPSVAWVTRPGTDRQMTAAAISPMKTIEATVTKGSQSHQGEGGTGGCCRYGGEAGLAGGEQTLDPAHLGGCRALGRAATGRPAWPPRTQGLQGTEGHQGRNVVDEGVGGAEDGRRAHPGQHQNAAVHVVGQPATRLGGQDERHGEQRPRDADLETRRRRGPGEGASNRSRRSRWSVPTRRHR